MLRGGEAGAAFCRMESQMKVKRVGGNARYGLKKETLYACNTIDVGKHLHEATPQSQPYLWTF